MISGTFMVLILNIYTNKKQSIREWNRSIHAFAFIRTSLHYALVAYSGARVPRVTRRSHARVRVSYECRCVFSLAVAPLLISTASSRRSLYGNSRLTAGRRRRRLSRPWSIAHRFSTHTHTPSLFGAHEKTLPNWPAPLAIRTAPIDNEIKGRTREKWSVAARRWLLLGKSLRYMRSRWNISIKFQNTYFWKIKH